ncbi:hypothetical protein D5086_005439 [Populus alba]|uniref:Uncharacterized protein n=1 Tax=Populus alba TaxID=43335 RepID=A0ACC4CUG2_POPAL
MWEANVGTTDLRYLKLVTSNADIKETIRYAKTLSQQDFFSHNTNRHENLHNMQYTLLLETLSCWELYLLHAGVLLSNPQAHQIHHALTAILGKQPGKPNSQRKVHFTGKATY